MTAPAARCAQMPEGAAAAAAARFAAALPRLETTRLVLRAPAPRDFTLWQALFAAPDSGFIGGPLSPEAAWKEFCVYTAGWLLQGHGLWSVERREDGALLGFVLLGLEWEDREPELGWLFDPAARGQGYATEAAAAARAHGEALFGAGRFVSCVEPGNRASAALAARLGAVRDPAAEAAIGGDTEIWRHGDAQ